MTDYEKEMARFYREQRRLKEINRLERMNELKMFETDTMISDITTVSKDVNLAEFMHKIGGVYRA